MKNKTLLLSLAVLLVYAAKAQVNFTDNFDQDSAGQYLAKNDAAWTTWSKSPGGADDILVSSDKSHSAPNALFFASAAGGPSDLVLPFTNAPYNTGNFSFSMWMFVNTAKKGYFNLQEQTTVGKGWSIEVNFDSLSNLTILNTNSGTLLTTTYTQNVWFKVEVKVNLNTNLWEIFIDNTSKGTFSNSYRAVASVDIYDMAGSSFYVDDVSYSYTPYVKPALNAALTYINKVSGYLATQVVTPQIEFRNLGTQTITSATIKINYNGNTQTKNITGINIASLGYDTVVMDPLTLAAGSKTFTATVSLVNGQTDNDTTDNSKSILLNPVVPAIGKLVVAEESTGTWCGWCVRGVVALKNLDEKYHGLIASIAVHNADPMANSNYDGGMACSSFPNTKVDRGSWFDPSAMETDFLNRLMIAPHAMITNAAQYDATTRTLKVSLSTKFIQTTSGNYKIACVLTEDSVHGTGKGWDQHNYYAGGGNGVMGGFENKPNDIPATQMVYDHVGRVICPNFNGLSNAFKASMNAGDSFVHNFTFVLDSGWNIGRMHIIGMVIDPGGRIDNGSATTFSEASANSYLSGTAVLGVQRLNEVQPSVNLFPNPAKNSFHISLDNKSSSTVSIFDMSGKMVKEITNFNGNELDIDSQNWNSGIYVVRINTGERTINAKLVIE